MVSTTGTTLLFPKPVLWTAFATKVLNTHFFYKRVVKLHFQELFPANKQSVEHFSKYFTEAGLKELSEYVRNQQSIGARKELQKELQEQMSRGDPFKDVGVCTRGAGAFCARLSFKLNLALTGNWNDKLGGGGVLWALWSFLNVLNPVVWSGKLVVILKLVGYLQKRSFNLA